jgi:tagatose-6-phosphate ketose/aldose isomerase
MNIMLNSELNAWNPLGDTSTANEIAQQPGVWRALTAILQTRRVDIDQFLAGWLVNPAHRVIFTGAGSSCYIGEIVADHLNAMLGAEVRAISSTSLLTHPDLYFDADRPTLLVSFGRSGNSPESIGAVALARQCLRSPRFLHITCNADGALAADQGADTLTLLLPPESCDRGFAMTSSFSCMLLAALAVFDAAPWSKRLQSIEQLASQMETLIPAWAPRVNQLAAKGFSRIVYLGSGPLESLAKESALKVLELTSGRILALANTSLGFRHGPKSVLNETTLVVVFRSVQAEARRYEQDLLNELKREQVTQYVVEVGPGVEAGADAEFFISAPVGLSDVWLAPLWLLLAQQFALFASAALGLTPDNPFPDGTVNRVVQGVSIYPHGVAHEQ